MNSSFNIAEVSELIARLVPVLKGDAAGFVTHHDIVSGVLSDPKGASIVTRARQAKPDAWSDDRSAASTMVAWFSQQVTIGVSPWSAYFDQEKRGDVWAYRPKSAAPQPIAIDPEALVAIEGDPRWFFHLQRERDPAIAKAKRTAARLPDGRLPCEACGFAARDQYPDSTAICARFIIASHSRRPWRRSPPPSQTWRSCAQTATAPFTVRTRSCR